jgi:hypothetical protein
MWRLFASRAYDPLEISQLPPQSIDAGLVKTDEADELSVGCCGLVVKLIKIVLFFF